MGSSQGIWTHIYCLRFLGEVTRVGSAGRARAAYASGLQSVRVVHTFGLQGSRFLIREGFICDRARHEKF